MSPYGAPPLSVVSSEQLRLQPTSSGYDPLEQVIAKEMVVVGGDGDGDGGEGGGGGGHAASQPPSHDASISSSAVRQAPRVRPWQAARRRRRQPLCTSSLGSRCCGRDAEAQVAKR